MMRQLSLLALVVVLAFGGVAFAQEATSEPDRIITVGDITVDTPDYIGQTLTVDGNVDELVNVRSFVLGGGGLGNPQLLIINNSGQEFDIGLTKDANVRVTGTVFSNMSAGGWDQIMSEVNLPGTVALTATPVGPEDQRTLDAAAAWLQGYPVTVLSNRFPEHTIILVNSMEDIVFTEPDA